MNFSMEFAKRRQSFGNFLLEVNILELLLSQYLLRFLASSYQIRHHLLSWTIRQVFIDLEILLGKLSCYLIRESF